MGCGFGAFDLAQRATAAIALDRTPHRMGGQPRAGSEIYSQQMP
jgi:hypothetical protein